jgi:formylglycine-generating enzyme required for sulfatase activity
VRLPTVAEWRFVAISGSESVDAINRGSARAYSSRELVRLAYAAENGSAPANAGGGRRDSWGLSDILGNVGEWVEGTPAEQAWWCGGNWQMPRATCLPDALTKTERQVAQKGVGLRLVVVSEPGTAAAQP